MNEQAQETSTASAASESISIEERRRELRERARREIPVLRREAEEAIATLHRLAGRS